MKDFKVGDKAIYDGNEVVLMEKYGMDAFSVYDSFLQRTYLVHVDMLQEIDKDEEKIWTFVNKRDSSYKSGVSRNFIEQEVERLKLSSEDWFAELSI